MMIVDSTLQKKSKVFKTSGITMALGSITRTCSQLIRAVS